MSKLLVVFGATGHQGSSVINYVLNDPELSQEYNIRAITRTTNSEKSQQLKEKKVEVVEGDVSNRASIEKALTGAHTIFAMTTPSLGPSALETEYNHAKTIADVAIEKGAKYIIFSTLPSVAKISGGKYTKVAHFDAKAKAEQYIRNLPIKSAFIALGFFMENLLLMPFLAPQAAPDGNLVLSYPLSPETRFPMVDATEDTGKFVGAILSQPDKYEGKTFYASTRLYSLEEITAIFSKVIGKTVIYKRISTEEFKQNLPFLADAFTEGFSSIEEFGAFGPDTEDLVAWAAENARGTLSTLEEFWKKNTVNSILRPY
ncbi:hypothetical protein N7495_004341 [Penicillium taxi]|uniref:uncharacterized protein n=1 Tax=Penicillium taxi TaxID=168475 RepID=UPI0025452423|nr:uncharacterized protein N7495_004341 [Penicillium taxi]KAJ5899597.1 hypothetical protein N7495_004341 [Penicillium taxi]